MMLSTPPFEGCSSEHVLAEVSRQVTSSEMRTLWGRMREEMRRKGVGAVVTYLEGEFTRMCEDFRSEMERIQNSNERGSNR